MAREYVKTDFKKTEKEECLKCCKYITDLTKAGTLIKDNDKLICEKCYEALSDEVAPFNVRQAFLNGKQYELDRPHYFTCSMAFCEREAMFKNVLVLDRYVELVKYSCSCHQSSLEIFK